MAQKCFDLFFCSFCPFCFLFSAHLGLSVQPMLEDLWVPADRWLEFPLVLVWTVWTVWTGAGSAPDPRCHPGTQGIVPLASNWCAHSLSSSLPKMVRFQPHPEKHQKRSKLHFASVVDKCNKHEARYIVTFQQPQGQPGCIQGHHLINASISDAEGRQMWKEVIADEEAHEDLG